MKKQELVKRNIELCSEFSRYLFDHPEMQSSVPADAELVLLPEEDPELRQFNLEMGGGMEKAGEKVVFVRIGSLRPRQYSRIKNAEFCIPA